MTITYSLNVANARLTGFSKLLLRWKGSIYKLLYREIAIFCTLYYFLSFLYRYVLNENHRIVFEKVALYCEAFTNLVPLTFVLGFYVSIVVTRWWQQFMQIPWPDKSVMLIAGNVHGGDERGRIIRRTLARYLLLLQVLTCQAVSTSVRRRFPTLDHIEEAGIMTKEERMVFDEIPGSHGKWWAPTVWFTNLVIRARKEGRIKDDILLQQLLDELHVYRSCCGMMFAYDWISIPLVYTQTVTIATYTYFLATVMGRQYLDPSKGYSNHDVDLYIPVFTIFEFFFFMGWLKVAEQLINPYGEDDDDFELNWCLDRNLLISFWIVDEMYNKHPRLVKDMYWDDVEPALPYTKSSAVFRDSACAPHHGSAMNLNIDPDESEFVPLTTIMEEDNDENTYSSPPTSPGNDLISIDTPIGLGGGKDVDTTSHSGLRHLADSFRGSRLFNMIIGQSNENVSSTPTKDSSGKGLGHPLMPPFTLKTPKKRKRTTSVSEPPRLYPAASSMHVSATDGGVGGTDGNRNKLCVGYGDLPTAPVIMSHRTPTRQRTPVPEHRALSVESHQSTVDMTITSACSSALLRTGSSSRGHQHPDSDQGFRFPQSFAVAPGHQQQFFQSLLPKQQSVSSADNVSLRSNNVAGDQEPEDVTSEVATPVIMSGLPTRNSSRLGSLSSSTAVAIDLDTSTSNEKPESFAEASVTTTPTNETSDVPESPYEPNLSEESLTPYGSNQSTVTSITELLKAVKKDKG